jgi:AraC-like DNA-binding protein
MTPRLSLSGARAAYVGPGLNLAAHRNAAATVAIALAAPFELLLPADPHGPAQHGEPHRVALIPPNVRHHLVAHGPMVFIYLDALGDDHRCLQRQDLDACHQPFALAGAAAVARWSVDTMCAPLGVPRRAPVDPRIAGAVRLLEARPQDYPRIQDLAVRAGLSASRLQALLTPAVGMPFRRYRLWRRMAVVMRTLAAGGTLTDAAHEAGFAGSSHLSATFRAMFGLMPSRRLELGVEIVFGDADGAATEITDAVEGRR